MDESLLTDLLAPRLRPCCVPRWTSALKGEASGPALWQSHFLG
jgi:hypothetical protein